MDKTFGEKATKFFLGLNPKFKKPADIQILLPYEDANVRSVVRRFFEKFYNDFDKRIFLFGINPGRYGAGTTGISFTDPLRLETDCGIENDFPKKAELSSDFIYQMIAHLGGPQKFYSKFFLTAICPVGFTSGGRNLNYYDDAKLQEAAQPFIVESIRNQLSFGADRRKAYCIGEGMNFKFLKKLNDAARYFETIVPLPHPRFIMQYRRKRLREYLDAYEQALSGT